MGNKPKISVVTVSYNQEKYIAQALEGFVSQRTNFLIEVIVSDDASTDRTQEIIKEYCKKYPDIITPYLRKKNVGVVKNFNHALQMARAPYVALCEGDDYWTDDTKLQQQYDFLEANKKFGLCFHKVKVIYEGNDKPGSTYPDGNIKPGLLSLLKQNFIQTNSVVYRRQNYDNLPEDILPLDWYLHLYHAQFGEIGFINKVMSVYRKHSGGIWWESNNNIDVIWKKYGISHVRLYMELLKIYGDTPRYRTIIDAHISGTLSAINRIIETQETELAQNYVDNFSNPADSLTLILSLCRTIGIDQRNLDESKMEIKTLEDTVQKKLDEKSKRITHLEHEKAAILNSRTYKTGMKISKVIKFMRIKK